MKKSALALLLTFGVYFVSNAQISSRIEQFGDTMFSAAGAGKIKTAMNGSVLLAAYKDNSVGGRLTVSSKDFTQGWILYGSAGISAGAPTCLDLTTDPIGNPIVAYADPVTSGKVVIQEWNGIGWSYVGGSVGVTPPNIQDVSVSCNTSTGFPSIAYKDPTASGKISVMTWNGSNWLLDDIAGFSNGAVGHVNICYSPTLTHNVVAYKDSSNMMAHSMYFNGSTWGYLSGGFSFTGGDIQSLDMEIDSVSGYPMYAVSEFDGSNYKASAYIHTGSSIAPIGITTFSPGAASMVNIASDNAGMYVVSFRDASLGNKATVMYNNGGGWNVVPGIFPTGPIGSCDIAVEGCGEFFVTYTDSSYQAQANSRRVSFPLNAPFISPGGTSTLCPSASLTLNAPPQTYANYEWLDSLRWDTVGTPVPFTNGSVIDMSYAAEDYSAQKFVAISDGNISGKLVCYKHGGGLTPWTVLGPGPISPSSATDICIKITPTHYPIIAFSDASNSAKLSVVRWNGSAWVNIGPVSVSAGQASEISMAITNGSKPVVAYQDFSVSNKLTVMYFNGTNWVALGGPGISAGQAVEPCVKISPLGEIYVAYSDAANGNKATVRKWTGSAWATIGTTGFTSGTANNPTLDFDGQGNIYMAYKDGAGSNGVTAMKYNFSSWATLTSNLSGGTAFNPKIHVDYSGNIYVSYIGFPSYAATIKKYNGVTTWDTVAHKVVCNTAASIFETDLGSTYGMPPSAVISFSPLGDKLIGFNFNYSYAGSYTNSQVVSQPGNYLLHVYKCNYSGTISANDALVAPVPNPTVTITALQDSVCAGLADTLIASGANTYLWSNASTNDSTVINPSATATYTVTGTDLNGCVGTTTTTVVVPTKGFAGSITFNAAPVNNGKMYFLPEVTVGKYDTIAVRNIMPGGAYIIDTIPNGNYLIKAIADSTIYTTAISTYNGNVGVWDSAQAIPHTCFTQNVVNIQLLQEYTPTGPGLISGTVYEGAGFGLRLAQGPGNPSPNTNVIPGVPIKVGKNPSGAIVGGTTTDVGGHFQFDSLPCDSYYVYTDVPGYPMDTLYKVTISCTGGVDTIFNLDYFIDSNSVYIDLTTSISNTGIAEKNSFINVYPNPSNGFIFLKQSPNTEGDLEVFVTDLSGKEVIRKSIRNNASLHTLDLSGAGKGIYMLRIIQNGKTSINKIIIY